MIAKIAIQALRQLVEMGEGESAPLAGFPQGRDFGLWTRSSDGSRIVATPALVELLSRLPDTHEVIIALASCQPKLRTAWQSIIAARLHEMGQRRDAELLCAAITELDRAAEAVRKLLPQARLAATGFVELENQLFGCPAEQGPAFPKLLRAIGRTSPYVEGRVAPPVQPLPDINPLTPETNWIPNRLLRPPAETNSFTDGPTSVLTGSLADLLARESDASDTSGTARLRWVLYRPWALLLAQVVFTQEAWAAEQNAGLFGLELADDQEAHFDAPARVNVVVARPTGEEIDCGSLGDHVLDTKSLDQLTLPSTYKLQSAEFLFGQLPRPLAAWPDPVRKALCAARNEFDEPVACLFHKVVWDGAGRGAGRAPLRLPEIPGTFPGFLPASREICR